MCEVCEKFHGAPIIGVGEIHDRPGVMPHLPPMDCGLFMIALGELAKRFVENPQYFSTSPETAEYLKLNELTDKQLASRAARWYRDLQMAMDAHPSFDDELDEVVFGQLPPSRLVQ